MNYSSLFKSALMHSKLVAMSVGTLVAVAVLSVGSVAYAGGEEYKKADAKYDNKCSDGYTRHDDRVAYDKKDTKDYKDYSYDKTKVEYVSYDKKDSKNYGHADNYKKDDGYDHSKKYDDHKKYDSYGGGYDKNKKDDKYDKKDYGDKYSQGHSW